MKRHLIYLPSSAKTGVEKDAYLASLGENCSNNILEHAKRAESGVDLVWGDPVLRLLRTEKDTGHISVVFYEGSLPDENYGSDHFSAGNLEINGLQTALVNQMIGHGIHIFPIENEQVYRNYGQAVEAFARNSGYECTQEALHDLRVASRYRDDYMIHSIERGLRPGEIGLLILGLYHDVVHRLPNDIELVFPTPMRHSDEDEKAIQSIKHFVDELHKSTSSMIEHE